jgi:hypothetical protein
VSKRVHQEARPILFHVARFDLNLWSLAGMFGSRSLFGKAEWEALRAVAVTTSHTDMLLSSRAIEAMPRLVEFRVVRPGTQELPLLLPGMNGAQGAFKTIEAGSVVLSLIWRRDISTYDTFELFKQQAENKRDLEPLAFTV